MRLVRGNPTPQELAALLAVLRALSATARPAAPAGRGRRTARWSLGSARPAAGTWRAEPPTHATVRRATGPGDGR
ncbi:acyl-CoA carboxylase epsilon subunit [Kitasatospora saccharophila]|uniref:acyl-CoA carboxylase epsilon subunit n=1 Tax=Kitasatospora saccharophila TaxID=407973 RepID=UPI003636914B